jgi:hypothetical protein
MQPFHQDVFRIREIGRFFSTQEPCKLPRGEAVFIGPKQGTPDSYQACELAKKFQKDSSRTDQDLKGRRQQTPLAREAAPQKPLRKLLS